MVVELFLRETLILSAVRSAPFFPPFLSSSFSRILYFDYLYARRNAQGKPISRYIWLDCFIFHS